MKGATSAPVHSTTQLAKTLNLSRWTISRVINGHTDVHPETAARVRAAIQAHGFSPNPLAQGLRRGRTDMVGACIPGLEDFHLSRKLDYLHSTLAKASLQVMLGMTNNTPEEEIRILNHFFLSRAAAVVLFATRLEPHHPAITQFHNAGIPFFSVDPIADWSTGAQGLLQVNRKPGMIAATTHLLALGHRSLALLGISGLSSYTASRRQAVEETVTHSNQSESIRLHHLPLPAAQNHYLAGYESARLYFTPEATSDTPTAILALNDRVAIGLLHGLEELGLRVPGDLSVIGYDNMEASSFTKPALSTISSRPEHLIIATTEAVLMALGSTETPACANPPPPIQSELIIRHTCGPQSSQ